MVRLNAEGTALAACPCVRSMQLQGCMHGAADAIYAAKPIWPMQRAAMQLAHPVQQHGLNAWVSSCNTCGLCGLRPVACVEVAGTVQAVHTAYRAGGMCETGQCMRRPGQSMPPMHRAGGIFRTGQYMEHSMQSMRPVPQVT
eukprot:358091-Chlamydomonas_euryale.AAC.2